MMKFEFSVLCLLTCFVTTAIAACSDGDEPESRSGNTGAQQSDQPTYVVATAVSTDDGSNTYVKVLPTLEDEQLDLSDAREFAGWSDIGVLGDWVFVSSGEEPTVTRFTLDAAGKLVEDGSISFARYTDDANFYSQKLLSKTKAYLCIGDAYVIWNPTTLEITGMIPLPEFEAHDGIRAEYASDRGMVVRGNRMFHTVNWMDSKNYRMGPTSRIVVVDLDEDSVRNVIEVDCPDLDVGDQDDAGNIYYSTWVYAPGATVVHGDKPACLVRIPAGSETIDSDWTIHFAELTGGHEASTVAYLGKGKLLTSVFYEDNMKFDPASDEMFDWLFGNNWKLHTLDIATRKLGDVTGIGWNGGGYYHSRFDDRTHLLVPGDGYTKTTMFGISSDGEITRELETVGWSVRAFRVR